MFEGVLPIVDYVLRTDKLDMVSFRGNGALAAVCCCSFSMWLVPWNLVLSHFSYWVSGSPRWGGSGWLCLVPSRQPYTVKYGGARVKAVSQTAKPYSLTAVEIGDLENRAYSHALVVCIGYKFYIQDIKKDTRADFKYVKGQASPLLLSKGLLSSDTLDECDSSSQLVPKRINGTRKHDTLINPIANPIQIPNNPMLALNAKATPMALQIRHLTHH
ncbi:hypothetical protein SeMB42_g06373 [Synchytrium endobioticum]|uniref:Uncharacterized protein n=1 Tax=Synchytrium endobioticum TaxID=286115 RepID=A0A507CLA7_9FUNG|nr:hypothetical protein SeMB42_g06373 [Synchytrium endobioticum]